MLNSLGTAACMNVQNVFPMLTMLCMAHPDVVMEEMVATNMFSEQSWMSSDAWSSSLGVGNGVKKHSPQIKKSQKGALDLDRLFGTT
jgi:hypothetical protein